jgi:AraC-like DNA-binding protein
MYRTQLFQWPDKMLFLGPLGEVGPHRHGATAWCIALDGELGFSAAGTGWQGAAGVQIAAGCPHRLHGQDRPVAVLYLHPEYDDWRAVAAGTGRAGARLLQRADPRLRALLRDLLQAAALPAAAHTELGIQLDGFLAHRRAPQAALPVQAAVGCIKSALADNLPLAELAAAARLSPGRLTHLFCAELGLPIRRFRSWHRLMRALELALRGRSLTQSALDSGFASPAHLSSVFQGTFGLAPSAVLRAPGLEFRSGGTIAAGPAERA